MLKLCVWVGIVACFLAYCHFAYSTHVDRAEAEVFVVNKELTKEVERLTAETTAQKATIAELEEQVKASEATVVEESEEEVSEPVAEVEETEAESATPTTEPPAEEVQAEVTTEEQTSEVAPAP